MAKETRISTVQSGRWGPTRCGHYYRNVRCAICKRQVVFVVGRLWLHKHDGTPYTQHVRQLSLLKT